MNLIDVNNIDCTKLPKKLYPYMKDILDFFDTQPTIDAIPKADYEARLKADLKAILVELQMEIQEFSGCSCTCSDGIVNDIDDLIQQKIDKLKGVEE